MEPVRVSTILSRLQDFGHIDPDVLKNKCEIGTDVHTAIKAHVDKDYFPMDEDRRICYFESYKLWANKALPMYEIMETRFKCPELNLSGQIDAVLFESVAFGLKLIDFKTSAKESFSRDGMSIWKMQAHMYGYLLKQNGITVNSRMEWIQLRTKRVKHEFLGYDMIVGAPPKIFVYEYDPIVMERCIDEVHKYWDERNNAKCFD
jgi:hypothetical protein